MARVAGAAKVRPAPAVRADCRNSRRVEGSMSSILQGELGNGGSIASEDGKGRARGRNCKMQMTNRFTETELKKPIMPSFYAVRPALPSVGDLVLHRMAGCCECAFSVFRLSLKGLHQFLFAPDGRTNRGSVAAPVALPRIGSFCLRRLRQPTCAAHAMTLHTCRRCQAESACRSEKQASALSRLPSSHHLRPSCR